MGVCGYLYCVQNRFAFILKKYEFIIKKKQIFKRNNFCCLKINLNSNASLIFEQFFSQSSSFECKKNR